MGLEADQSPSQFHQGSSESGVAVFSHAALQSRIAAAVFAGTQAGVAGNLTTIIEPVPITNLPIDEDAGRAVGWERRRFAVAV